MSAYISLKDVVKTYKVGDSTINACDGVTLDIDKGQFVIIVGPSGAGKTTVLNILGGMDTLTSGSITVDYVPERSFLTGARMWALYFSFITLWQISQPLKM